MQEHVSEYGVHWNFFFTLAGVACIAAILPLFGTPAATLATTLAISYQALLSLTPLSAWLERNDRDPHNLLDANKEGLVSLVGYVALYYSGAALASLVNSLTPVPLDTKERQSASLGCRFSVSRWHIRMTLAATVLWLATLLSDVFVQPVSRRLCNLTYVLWTTSMAVTLLYAAAVAELVSAKVAKVCRPGCPVLDGLSKHQLAAFLAANVMTGVINLTMDTLSAGPVWTWGVLGVYTVAWGLAGVWGDVLLKPLRFKRKQT
jgi:glucosaminylphosphatidylinositol acyltransferase